MDQPRPTFFEAPADFRSWLERNHDKAAELWVGFRKRASGQPSITWPEAVDQALCFGWIDGIRKGVDDTSYMNRFTPRKPTSTWSARNLKRANELIELGLMTTPGVRALESRRENRTGIYSYEQRPADLPLKYARTFRANAEAWSFWRGMPPSYRKA